MNDICELTKCTPINPQGPAEYILVHFGFWGLTFVLTFLILLPTVINKIIIKFTGRNPIKESINELKKAFTK